VIGKVWATKRLDEAAGRRPSEVALEEHDGPGEHDRLDPLGAGDGERVLITQGSVARGWFRIRRRFDALVISILDMPRTPRAVQARRNRVGEGEAVMSNASDLSRPRAMSRPSPRRTPW
jgi:microcompartment protein CcmK/EutM